jgi:hypothetical protein
MACCCMASMRETTHPGLVEFYRRPFALLCFAPCHNFGETFLQKNVKCS